MDPLRCPHPPGIVTGQPGLVITATAYRSACRPSRGGAAADPHTQAPAETHTGPQPAGSGSAPAPTGRAAGGSQQAQPVGGDESMSSLRTVRPFSWCAWMVHGSGTGSDTSPETFRSFASSPPRAGRARRPRRRRAAPLSAATTSTPETPPSHHPTPAPKAPTTPSAATGTPTQHATARPRCGLHRCAATAVAGVVRADPGGTPVFGPPAPSQEPTHRNAP